MRIALTLSVCLLCGCATDYAKFYQGVPDATPEVVAKTRITPAPKAPALEHAGGALADVISAYGRRGYAVIGFSAFSSGHQELDDAAVAQGAEVGADVVVVVNPKYAGAVSTVVPITTPTTSTSYTAGPYGSVATTTYGSQTNYFPMTIQRYEYGALYLYKRHWHFGATYRDLNDDERRALQSNKGVYIATLVDGSPAYESDVLVGDVVVAVDGQPVYGQQAFATLLAQNIGRTIQLTIVRGGQIITKSVALIE